MLFNFPAKFILSREILRYIGDKKVVCFTCGNASKELRLLGVDVLEIGVNGAFIPNHWYTQQEIADIFPTYFDATSGHLPMDLMLNIAESYRHELFDVVKEDEEYDVHCGSGETLICLKLAFPNAKFNALYNVPDLLAETEYNQHAPLNKIVKLLANKIFIGRRQIK